MGKLSIAREDYLYVVDKFFGDAQTAIRFCATKLLNLLVNKSRWKQREYGKEWFYITQEQMRWELLGEHSLHRIREAIALLVRHGLLEQRNRPDNSQDKTFQYRPVLKRLEKNLAEYESSKCEIEDSKFNVEDSDLRSDLRSNQKLNTNSFLEKKNEDLQDKGQWGKAQGKDGLSVESSGIECSETKKGNASSLQPLPKIEVAKPILVKDKGSAVVMEVEKKIEKKKQGHWIPEGPWAVEGVISSDFVETIAEDWAREWGYSVSRGMANVMLSLKKDSRNFEIYWTQYKAIAHRRVNNAIARIRVGMQIKPEEQEKLLASARAVIGELPSEVRVLLDGDDLKGLEPHPNKRLQSEGLVQTITLPMADESDREIAVNPAAKAMIDNFLSGFGSGERRREERGLSEVERLQAEINDPLCQEVTLRKIYQSEGYTVDFDGVSYVVREVSE